MVRNLIDPVGSSLLCTPQVDEGVTGLIIGAKGATIKKLKQDVCLPFRPFGRARLLVSSLTFALGADLPPSPGRSPCTRYLLPFRPQYPRVEFKIPGKNQGGTIELTGDKGQANKAKAEILKLVSGGKNKNKTNKNNLDNQEGGPKNKKAKKAKNNDSTNDDKKHGMDTYVQSVEEQHQFVELTKLQLLPPHAARHHRASRTPPTPPHLGGACGEL